MADLLPAQGHKSTASRFVVASRLGRAAVVLAGAAALFLPLSYVAAGRETTTVEAARMARPPADGEGYIPLSAGITHYRYDGPESGPVVVLVHGYMDTLADWDGVVPALTSAGLRVLRYDMYGTGLSARPPVPYTREMLRGQLRDLLDRLHVPRPDIVGHSLGGAITVDFTSHQPDRVHRVALLAPAVHVNLPTLQVVRLPLLGRYLARTRFVPDVAGRLGARASRGERWAAAAIEHLQYRGTEEGFLSIIVGDGFSDYVPECERVGRSGRPVLLAWGDADVLVGREAMTEARRAMPTAEWHELAGAPHELPMDRAPLVARLLVEFLQRDRPQS